MIFLSVAQTPNYTMYILSSYLRLTWWCFDIISLIMKRKEKPVIDMSWKLQFTRRSCLVVSCRHTLSVKRLADSNLGSCLELLSPISQCTSSSTFFSHSNRLLKTSHFYVQSSKSKETVNGKLRWLAKWVEN